MSLTPTKSAGVRLLKQQASEAIKTLAKLHLLDREKSITRNDSFVFLPLKDASFDEVVKTLEKVGIQSTGGKWDFAKCAKSAPELEEILTRELPSDLRASLPHSMDVIGDIIVVEIPQKLDGYKTIIGKALLKSHPSAKTVLAKAGPIAGTYRLRELALVAGEDKTQTVHKEYGCQFHVDLARAYFSPRLSYEHNRVASVVTEVETIIDLFAGVGPFAIMIAKKHDNVNINAIDANPNAVELMRRNIRANRVDLKVHAFLGDARRLVHNRFSGTADRVIMNLPESALQYIDVAREGLKSAGGILHFYCFAQGSNALEASKGMLTEAVRVSGAKVESILGARFVRETAPHQWQIVIDARIC